MGSEQVLKYIGMIVFLVGIFLLGWVFYYLVWTNWATYGWDHFYTWLIIIGVPCLAVGTYLVNKYFRG